MHEQNIYEALRTIIRQAEILFDADRAAPKDVPDDNVLKVMKYIFGEHLSEESFAKFMDTFFTEEMKKYLQDRDVKELDDV